MKKKKAKRKGNRKIKATITKRKYETKKKKKWEKGKEKKIHLSFLFTALIKEIDEETSWVVKGSKLDIELQKLIRFYLEVANTVQKYGNKEKKHKRKI